MSIKGFVRGVDQRLTELERRPLRVVDHMPWLWGGGTVSKTMAQYFTYSFFHQHSSLKPNMLRLFSGKPKVTNARPQYGWDFGSTMMSGAGYADVLMPQVEGVDWSSPTGHDPVTIHNLTSYVFTNTGAVDWPPITHMGIYMKYEHRSLLFEVPEVVLPAGKTLTFPPGSLSFNVSSI